MNDIVWTDLPLVIDYEIASRPCDEEGLWERSVFPIGNGRLGGTVFGDPLRERIQFNQDSLWVGNEDCTGGYQPFGDLYIEMSHGGEYEDYRRELDIGRALQTVSYRADGVNYRREYFSSYPAQVMVFRFSADRSGALSGVISMGNVHTIPIAAEDDTLIMKGDTSRFWWWGVHRKEPRRLMGSREYASDKNIDLNFEAVVKVLNRGGSLKVSGDTVVFEGCDDVTILLGADTDYLNRRDKGWRGEDPHGRISENISRAAGLGYAALLNDHITDYQSRYCSMSIDLGGDDAGLAEIPTYTRVEKYRERLESGDGAVDRALESLLYRYARYLMISSSREGYGGLPANLQGIWLINKRPSWRCDFHTDINLQMNYWFTSASNLTECFKPLAEWIDSIRDVRKEETRRVLGVDRGWLMRSENGIFGGSTWHFQKGDSAWLCQNLWEHYEFTRDGDYLKRYAYPVMKEISEFWVDHLKELPDGTLVAPDGRSPEHGPESVDGVSYDQELCRELFTNTIEASRVLGVDSLYRGKLKDMRERLLVPKIGRWGQLQEWMDDIDDPEDDHRHINHLIAVYPGHQIRPDLTPELAEAARVGLIARAEHGKNDPGWSKVWKACVFARLFEGERAYRQLSGMIAGRLHGNLWAVHPPFQIDCNFGYAAAVNEMLVQSCRGDKINEIHLLPALPEVWSKGSVKGMRLCGGYALDMTWRDGALIKAVVHALSNDSGDRCRIRYRDQIREFAIARGDSWEFLVLANKV